MQLKVLLRYFLYSIKKRQIKSKQNKLHIYIIFLHVKSLHIYVYTTELSGRGFKSHSGQLPIATSKILQW